MKWTYATVAVFALFVASACGHELEEEEGDARFGFVSIDANGNTALTFNASSIQNAVILGLFVLVLGALLVPLFAPPAAEASSGYGSEYSRYSNTGYEDPASAGYNGYSKRSLLQSLNPVMTALSAGQKKYEEEDQ